jgi:hypothetical protein
MSTFNILLTEAIPGHCKTETHEACHCLGGGFGFYALVLSAVFFFFRFLEDYYFYQEIFFKDMTKTEK